MSDVLFEIGSSEIPASMQEPARKNLELLVGTQAKRLGWTVEGLQTWATPRRLAFWLTFAAKNEESVKKGPRVDAPDVQVDAFFRKMDADRASGWTETTPQGSFWFAKGPPKDPQRDVEDLCKTVLKTLFWPRRMQWGNLEETWIRPVTSVLCLLDGRRVPWRWGDLETVSTALGHPLMHKEPVLVSGPEAYERVLFEKNVVLDGDARKQTILEALHRDHHLRPLAQDLEAGGLIDTVVGLVEWPVPYKIPISEDFMALPPEVVSTVIRVHQKLFALETTTDRRLAPFCMAFANAPLTNGDAFVKGVRRVVEARLRDALFFWTADRKRLLGERSLHTRQLYHGLGTVQDKVARLSALVPTSVQFLANLCKADLDTNMVNEFPELQGTMGKAYALAEGMDPADAEVLETYYKSDPESMSEAAQVLGFWDRLDTLVGFWALNVRPTGSSDPLALRRAGNGLVRLMVGGSVPQDLKESAARCLAEYQKQGLLSGVLSVDLAPFLTERLAHLLKQEDIIFQETSVTNFKKTADHARRTHAFLQTETGRRVAETVKRLQPFDDGKERSVSLGDVTLQEERAVFEALQTENVESVCDAAHALLDATQIAGHPHRLALVQKAVQRLTIAF